MVIHFVECEETERELFQRELPEHDLRFVTELREIAPDAEVISIFINSAIDAEFLKEHPRLRYIASRSGAIDHVDLASCRQRSVLVSNVPDYGDHTVAEHTFALILAVSRRLREVMAAAKTTRRFSYAGARAFDLHGKTLGIVGLGQIGRRVAALAHAFEMQVVAFDPVVMSPEIARHAGVEWVTFDQLLARSHIISLHVRLSPATYHLFDRDAFAKCQKGVVIINTSRGRLIETEALLDALECGQVGGAGLDVMEQEGVMRQSASQLISAQIVEHLRDNAPADEARPGVRLKHLQEIVSSDAVLARTNVVFTPHVAFNSLEAVERLQAGTIENLRAYCRGEPINLVGSE